MYIVERDFTFCAAHYLPGHEKCGKMHGHNYKVTVRLKGPTLNKMGMVVDFSEMKKIVSKIIDKFDHSCLNEKPGFPELYPPTAENIAEHIYYWLEQVYKAKMHSVTVQETDTCRVTYRK